MAHTHSMLYECYYKLEVAIKLLLCPIKLQSVASTAQLLPAQTASQAPSHTDVDVRTSFECSLKLKFFLNACLSSEMSTFSHSVSSSSVSSVYVTPTVFFELPVANHPLLSSPFHERDKTSVSSAAGESRSKVAYIAITSVLWNKVD